MIIITHIIVVILIITILIIISQRLGACGGHAMEDDQAEGRGHRGPHGQQRGQEQHLQRSWLTNMTQDDDGQFSYSQSSAFQREPRISEAMLFGISFVWSSTCRSRLAAMSRRGCTYY